MIANQCLTKEWIVRKRDKMGNVDPALLEKSIHAVALLCALGESSIPFVFKGGTSMILLLNEFHRLSIDIDIVTLMPRTECEPILADIGIARGASGGFIGNTIKRTCSQGVPLESEAYLRVAAVDVKTATGESQSHQGAYSGSVL